MIYCATCGKAIPKDSRFCTFCGATVPVVEPGKPNIATPSPATPPNIQSSTPGPTYTRESFIPTATPVARPKLEFFKNPGFYGGAMVIAAYFLPWLLLEFSVITGMEMMSNYLAAKEYLPLALMIVPLAGAALLVINSFGGFLEGLTGLAKTLSFLAILVFLVLWVIYIQQHSSLILGVTTDNVGELLSAIGLGFWLALGGTFIMLFNKKVV